MAQNWESLPPHTPRSRNPTPTHIPCTRAPPTPLAPSSRRKTTKNMFIILFLFDFYNVYLCCLFCVCKKSIQYNWFFLDQALRARGPGLRPGPKEEKCGTKWGYPAPPQPPPLHLSQPRTPHHNPHTNKHTHPLAPVPTPTLGLSTLPLEGKKWYL